MKELEYVLPGEIEKRSFEIIGQELKEMHITIPADEEPDHPLCDRSQSG